MLYEENTGFLSPSIKENNIKTFLALAIEMEKSLRASERLTGERTTAVSCRNARTRSPSAIMAYLIVFHNYSYDSARTFVSEKYNTNSSQQGGPTVDREERYKSILDNLCSLCTPLKELDTEEFSIQLTRIILFLNFQFIT